VLRLLVDVAILFLFIAGCCSLIPVRGRRWSSGDRC